MQKNKSNKISKENTDLLQKSSLEVTVEQTELKKVKIKKVIGHEARTNRWGYFFVAPFIVAFLIFNFWPTINTMLISATNLRGFQNEYIFSGANCPSCNGTGERTEIEKVGGGIFDAVAVDEFGNEIKNLCDDCDGKKKILPISYNYNRLVNDKIFWKALGNTFIIWGMNFIPQLGLALILAIWLSDVQLNLTGKGLFRAIVYMPNLLTAASVALLFRSLFGEGGPNFAPVNQILRYLNIIGQGEAIEFFRNDWYTRGIVAFIQWWMWYGHTLILLMAGITSIPSSLYESATVDGANSRQTAWYITLPLLRPMMLFILVTSMIGGMQMFDIPISITNGRGDPNNSILTTVLYQYNVGIIALDRSYGSTISIGIFIVTVIFALLIFFFLQDRSELKKRKGGAV